VPQLLPHQVTGAEWLADKRHALLADEMRVGKAVQTVVACDLLGAERILVICPAVARINWLREFGKFSTRSLPMTALLSSRDSPLSHGVNVVSYDLLSSVTFAGDQDVLVLDESHYLKSCGAKRTKLVLGKGGLIHRARRTWALSGTPAPNNASELWPILRVFGVYPGGYDAFVQEFCTGFLSPYGFKITGSKNVMKLRELLSKVMLRRTMKEVRPEMPAIEFDEFVVEPDFQFYERDDAYWSEHVKVDDALFEGKDLAGVPAPTLRRYTGLAKVQAVVDLVKMKLDGGAKKIVLFAYHREVIQQLTGSLMRDGVGAVSLYGDTSQHNREKNMRAFRLDPSCQVFIGQIVAAGTNIDLSVADEALFVEASWVPGENAQAAARLQNVNKSRLVTATFVALADSIDERIQTALRRKTKDLVALFN
jgi:SWI/SNF-related matrix-associated actin-dependent regulator 1 of chromatin subfamily A